MEGKKWYHSKTLWIGAVLVPAGIILKEVLKIDLPVWVEPVFLAVVATILRAITKESIVF